MQKIQKYLRPNLNSEIQMWLSTTLNKYLIKNEENQTEIEHIIDFLESDMAPVRLKRMSYIQAKASTEKWTQLLQKRGATIEETDNDTIPFIQYKSGFKFVQLKSENSFKREGSLMSHCVASYYGKKDIKVYSLRDLFNKPHCTIEVVGDDSIEQIKGKGNGSIHPNYITYVVSFLKKLGMDVKSNELKNLGYVNVDEVTSGFSDFIKNSFPKAKFKTFNKINYLYIHSLEE